MDREATFKEYLSQLADNPTDLGPLKRVERELVDDWGEYVRMLESMAERVDQPILIARLYLEAGRSALAFLDGEQERAQQLLDRAAEAAENTGLHSEVRLFQIASREGQEELLQYFTQALEQSGSNVERSRLYQRMGFILEQMFGDEGEATNAYKYARELDAENLAAMWAQERIARSNESWGELGELLAQELEIAGDTGRQVQISVELGNLYLRQLDNDEAALECFTFAYELAPENRDAKEGLVELGELDASELKAQSQGEEAPPPQSDLDADVEQEVEEPIQQEDSESESGAEEALDEEVSSVEDEEPDREPVGAESSEVEVEAEAVDSEEEAEGEIPTESVEEPAGEVHELEEDSIVEVGEDVDEQDVDEQEGGEPNEEQAAEAGEFDEEESAVEGDLGGREERIGAYRESARAADGPEAVSWLVEAARLEWLNTAGEEADPSIWRDAAECGVLEELFGRTHYFFYGDEYWSEVEAIAEEAGASPGLLGKIALFHLGDPDLAESYAEQGEDEELEQALEDLEDAESNWRRFQRSLDKRHADLPDDEQARVVYNYLANLARATGQDKKEVDSLRRLDRQVDDPQVKERLMVCYRRSEKWPMYVDLVKEQAERIDEERIEDRVDWLEEAVRVYRYEMDHDMMVVNTYKEILELDPDNIEAVESLIELYGEMNRSSELINALQQKAELVDDDEEKIELYTRIAQLFLDKFRNQAEAIDAFESVLEIDPDHSEALEFLTEMYEKRRDWKKLVDVRRRSVEALEDEEQKLAGLKEVAELASEKLRKPDVATELWLQVRENAPKDRDALDALEQLYEKDRDYEKLAEVVEQKVELVEDDAEAMGLFQKLGMLYSDRLEDAESAIEAWRRALEIEPDDRKARKALERLYVDNRKWDELEEFYGERGEYRELVRMLDTLVGTVEEDEVKIEILLRAVRIWRTELEEIDRAKRNLERAREIDEHHVGIARELEPIYRQEDDWEGLREVLQVILDHQDEPEARHDYQLQLAELHENQLEAPSGAFDWYARAVAEVPGAGEVTQDLERVAGASGRWGDLVEIYEKVLGETDDPEVIEGLRLKLGRVFFEQLGQSDAALEQFQAVLDEDEENLEALAQVERIHRQAERWDELMGVYQRRLELTESDEDKVEILRGIAEIAELQKGDIDEAISQLNEARELDPRDEKTLRELHRLYRESEEWEDLADVVERQIDILEDRARDRAEELEGAPVGLVDPGAIVPTSGGEGIVPEEEQSLEADSAEARSEEQGEFAESDDTPVEEVSAEEAPAEEVPAEEEEFEAAEEAEEIEGAGEDRDQEEQLDVGPIEREVLYTEAEVERLVELRHELGVVQQEHLGREAEAVDALSRVLEWRPDHEGARSAIERCLEEGYERARAAEVLSPVYRVHGEWEELVDVLEMRVEATDDEAERIDLFEESGDVFLEEIGDPTRSFDAYGDILHLDPSHEDARSQLVWIAEGADLWERLAELYDDVSESLDEADELRREYLFELGDIYAVRLDEPETAESYFDEVRAVWPDDEEVLDRLESVYARTERWRDLLGVFEEKLEYADGAERRDLQFRLAVLHDRFLEQPTEAIGVLSDMLDEDPENLRAVRAISRMYEDNELWDDLAEMVQRELELVEPAEEYTVKQRLAEIFHRHLDDQERAVDLYEEVLEERPDDVEAIRSMEELMEHERAPSGRISRILEPLYEEREQWDRLIWALEVQVEDSDDPEERVALLHWIARLREERQGDQRGAQQTHAEALADDPENETTLDEIYRLTEEIGDWRSLVGIFEERAEQEADPDLRRDMLRRAAAIYIRRLESPRDATPLLQEVLEIYPDDLETIEELEEIYRSLEAWDDLVAILRHKSAQLDEVEERKALLYQAGNIFDEILERPEEAVEVYREVLEVDAYDSRAIDRLEELYTRLEWWAELLEVYEMKLEQADNDEARKDLLYVIAPLHEEQLDQPYEAIGTYRDILEIDPQELGALENLADLYEETEQWHELLEALEEQMELVSLPEERLGLHHQIGTLWETELGDVLEAVEVYREILEEEPEHEPTREALAGLIERGEAEVEAAEVLHPIYEEAGEWEKLVHVERLLIESSHDPDRKLELYREIGDIYEHRLERPAAAFDNYLEALEVAPGRESLLDTAERLAAELGAWDVLIDRFDEVLDETNDFEVVFELNRRIGRILDEELNDPRGAIERYESALEVEPEDPQVTEALDVLYQEEDEWEKLAEILTTRIYTAEGEEQTLELRSRLGLLYQNALEQPEKAVDTYQEILADDPENDFAIGSLEEMFMIGQEPLRIMGILEPWYVDRDRHDKLVDLYMQRIERLDDPMERFDLLQQVGELYLHELDQPANALQVYGTALQEQPDDEDVTRKIDELAEETGEWNLAADFYYKALQTEEVSDDAAVDLWGRLARIFDEELGQIEDAETAYRRVLEVDPGDPDALEALDRIFERQERWGNLAEILRQRLEHTYDEEVIVDVDFRLAQIYQYELDELEKAVDTYRDLLDIQPMHQETLEELEKVHRAREQWDELFDVLDRRADATDHAEEKIECYSQMATLAEQMLDRPFDAMDLWNKVLEHEPDHRDALRELGRLYYDEERWDELVGILERELELVEDEREQLELYKSLGTVWGDKLGNDGPALDSWRSVLEIDPEDLEGLRAVRDLYTRQGDYEELAPILRRLIDHEATSEMEELELWIELAEIRGEMLLDTEGAVEAWRQVLALDPEHDRALDNLEDLYLQEAKWEEAAQVLEIKADRTEEAEERIDILARIADIWEHKLEEPDRATVFYEQILDLDPTDMQASHSLEEIYRAQGTVEDHQGLVELYLDRAEVLDDRPFDRMEALRSAARVFEEELENPINALVVLVSAFNIDTYDDEQLQAEIERLARETGEWGEVVEKYQSVIRELGDSSEAARLHEQVGRWYSEELDRPDDAIYHLRRAIEIDPNRVEILEALQNLYRDLESWPELANVLQERIEMANDPNTEVELWRNLGELYELQMGKLDEAIDAYRSILEIEETDLLAIESLERIFESDERWEELIEVLEQKADSTYDPDDVVEIRLRIASIYEEQLVDLERAIEAYEELLSVETDNEDALDALERLYFETKQWEALLDIYQERLSLTHEPEEQVDIHGQVAAIWENQLEDPHRAVEAYDEILVVEPDHKGAMRNLERLYRDLEEWFDLVEILQNHIEVVDDADRQIELYNELARVQQEQIGEPYAAIEAYEASLELDSSQAGVLFDLAQLHEETSNWEGAVDAYEELLHLLDSEEDQIEVHFTVGQVLEEELRNDVDAEYHYKKALEFDPDHQPAWDALERLYERSEDWEGLIDLYTTAADQTRDLTEKAQYFARAGSVYDLELGERRRALDFYEQALEEDPNELEAAEPLIDLYLEEDEWERAVPLLEMVIDEYESATDVDREELEDRYVQLARVYEDLQQDRQAIDQYWNAFDLDRSDVDVLLGLGRLLFEQEQYRDAEDILTRLEEEHGPDLTTEERIDLYYRLGKTKQEFDELDASIGFFESAIELDGYHRPTLEALVDVHEEALNWDEVVEYKRRLLDMSEEDKVRFALLTDIGEICVDELGDTNRAIATYQQALEIKSESVAVLRKLLEIYRSANQWHEAVSILDRLIEQQEEPKRKAKFSYTTAIIYRDKIGNPKKAVEYFDQALDNEISQLEAFEAIDRIFTEMREWKELERAYRRMLRRIAENDEVAMEDIKFKLWEGLGEIYRSRLGHPKSAIQAFETATGLQPDNERIRLILAELYETTGDNTEGVIEQHKAMIEQDPFRIESYKALFRVYLEANRYDRAWCMAAALTFLEKASEEERRIYEQYRGKSLRKAKANLDQEAFDKIYHPDQEMLVSYIMSILNQGLRQVYADDIKKDWGLHPKKDKLDTGQGTLFANVYNYVAETINIAPVPEVYLKKDQALGVRNANVHPPAIVAGADVVQNTDARELAFRISKLLSGMRSEHYLGSIGWPTEILKMFFMAAMHVTNPNLGLEQQLGEQGLTIAQEIQNMPSQMQMQLRKHVSQYLKTGKNPNLSRWLRHVEHTTNRVGLLVCGDLETAASFIKSDRNALSKAPVKEKIRELILFVISDEYTELRERLGLAIG